jgi:outer membrane protein TolC
MKTAHTFTIALLLILTAVSHAKDEKLSLSQALQRARLGHPSLLSALEDVAAARARSAMRNAAFRPVISVNGTAASGEGSMIFPSAVMPINYPLLPTDNVGVLNGTAMWRFWTSGRDGIARKLGAAEVIQFQARADLLAVDVDLGVREAFSNVVFRKDVLNARQSALDASTEMLRVTLLKFENGSAPKAFVLRAEADVAGMQRELAMAQAELGMGEAMVRERVGLDQSGDLQLEAWDQELVAPVTKQEAIDIAMKQHPELTVAGLAIDIARLRGLDASRSKLPEASLMAMGDWMGTRGMSGSATTKFGLVVSFPLVDGGERNAAQSEADAMAKKMTLERRMLQLQIQAKVASAFAEWRSVPPQRRAAKAQLAASQEAFRVMGERYGAGMAVLVELIDARAQVAIARVNVAEVEAFARSSWARLIQAMGGMPRT